MDQARTTISKIFNGEPHSYARFNLTQNMEGDHSHVETKLSVDTDDDLAGNGAVQHRHHNGVHGPTHAARKPGRSPRNVCFLVAATLLIFIIGYLIGYLVHRKKEEVAASCPQPLAPVNGPSVVQMETGAAPLMDWDDLKALLDQQLSKGQLDQAFSDFASDEHQAGTPGDDALANKVLRRFKDYGMEPWTDEHYVKVQELPATKTNRVTFKDDSETLTGFLSYSATGSVTGAIIYANYGQTEDFTKLPYDTNLTGRVVLVKTGKISFAEKVANAAKMNASAVLIYADPASKDDTQLYGHVHLGSGDPYTPGFPSFNHTTFAPVSSSGLPSIPAQTITAGMAKRILSKLAGRPVPQEWLDGPVRFLGDTEDQVTLEVNNVLVEKKINNVLGVIKGYVDPDRYVILGAQRDSWGPGFAKSTVGTSVLVELARAISAMVKDGRFVPRRSMVFASWSAGEYGSVGATEWLEGYLSSLSMKAFTYINLDTLVTGADSLKASASPLLQNLMKSAVEEVKSQVTPSDSLYKELVRGEEEWQKNCMQPMQMDDAAYPFLAFSGIPSVSFRLTGASDYPYLGTPLDTRAQLNSATGNQVSRLALSATQLAGHMTLRLVHDHLLRFDLRRYDSDIRSYVSKFNRNLRTIQRLHPDLLPKALVPRWIISAAGSFSRAVSQLLTYIENSQLNDVGLCREVNDRLMQVERNLLSPYVSPRDRPFRHVVVGSGPHTLQALLDHLEAFQLGTPHPDPDVFQNQFALATWTIQGCANSLAGPIWSLDNEI